MPIIHKLKHQNSGVVLVTVLTLIIVLSIVAIGTLSMNVNRIISGQSVVDTIKAEQLALGVFYHQHQLRMEGCPSPPCAIAGDCSSCITPNETLGLKTFEVTVTPESGATGPNVTKKIETTISY